jgi:hypothetical protein
LYGQSIITKDIGTGHWVRLELGNSNPVAKIFLINTKHVAYKDLMTAFELRVGKYEIDNTIVLTG